jgi:hypothetical protein
MGINSSVFTVFYLVVCLISYSHWINLMAVNGAAEAAADIMAADPGRSKSW